MIARAPGEPVFHPPQASRNSAPLGHFPRCLLIFPLLLANCSKQPAVSRDSTSPEPAPTVIRNDDEWRARLTPEQYRVLRQAGTEPPFGKTYEAFKHQAAGSYHCAGCDALLFHSDHKFDSGCGWPSFYDPADARNVVLRPDHSLGDARTEVLCAVCGGHLGHVFEGEGFNTPTDQRYCINGVALKFVPAAPP
jgi:peptide-methionine (R)-S-oxide reductase